MPTNSQTFADWIKQRFGLQTWPAPTLIENIADAIIAPIDEVLSSWLTRPVGWLDGFKTWLTTRLTSYGTTAFLALSDEQKATLTATWWEEYSDETGYPAYSDPVQGGG